MLNADKYYCGYGLVQNELQMYAITRESFHLNGNFSFGTPPLEKNVKGYSLWVINVHKSLTCSDLTSPCQFPNRASSQGCFSWMDHGLRWLWVSRGKKWGHRALASGRQGRRRPFVVCFQYLSLRGNQYARKSM